MLRETFISALLINIFLLPPAVIILRAFFPDTDQLIAIIFAEGLIGTLIVWKASKPEKKGRVKGTPVTEDY